MLWNKTVKKYKDTSSKNIAENIIKGLDYDKTNEIKFWDSLT